MRRHSKNGILEFIVKPFFLFGMKVIHFIYSNIKTKMKTCISVPPC